MKKIRIICLVFALVLLVGAISCMFLVQNSYAKYSSTSSATHRPQYSYSDDIGCDGPWVITNTTHSMTCDTCNTLVVDNEAHVYGVDGKCTVCGGGCDHQYDDYGYDETQHWSVCSRCGVAEEGTRVSHSYNYTVVESGKTHSKTCVCGHTVSSESCTITSSVVTEPTCTAPGYTTHTCGLCGGSYSDSVQDPLDHDISEEWSSDGVSHWKECSRCDYYESSEVHTPSATSTYDDTNHWYNCSVCDAVITASVKAHTPGSAATCTTAQTCTGCDKVISPALNHNEITVLGYEATCTETGLTDGRKCSRCGKITVAQQEIALAEHETETIEGFAATCTDTGVSDGKICTVCGEVTVVPEEIPAIGHTEVTLVGKSATCTEPGLTDGVKCSVCNETLTAQEPIEATGHTTVITPAVAATCTTNGYTEGEMCSTCGTITKAQTVVVAAGHPEDKLVTLERIEPTCTATGLAEGKRCGVCNEITVKQMVIPANGHTEAVLPGVEPTCTEVGLTEGVKCSVCNAVITKQNEINAKGHDNNNGVITLKPTCTTDGSKTVTCQTCGDSYTTVVKATGHAYIHNSSTGVIYCAICGENADAPTPVRFFGKTTLDDGVLIYGNGTVVGSIGTITDYQNYVTVSDLAAPLGDGTSIQFRISVGSDVVIGRYLVLKYRITGNNNLSNTTGASVYATDGTSLVAPMSALTKGTWSYVIFDMNGKTSLAENLLIFVFDNTGVEGDSIDIECVGSFDNIENANAWGNFITNAGNQSTAIIDDIADIQNAYGYHLYQNEINIDSGSSVNGSPIVPIGSTQAYPQDEVIAVSVQGPITSVNLRGHANIKLNDGAYVAPISKIGYTIDSLSKGDIVWMQNPPAVQEDLEVNRVGANAVRFNFTVYDLNVQAGETVTLRVVYELDNGMLVTAVTLQITATATAND